MIELNIDPEFRDKIPPLTEAEFEQLKENILEDGEVYEPIAVWNGTIVDGHNRWKVIQENWELLKDKYRTKSMDFADKWAAFEWMYKKQLGRRNLTDEQRTVLTGKMYEARMHTISNPTGVNQYTKEDGSQNGAQPKERNRVSEQIAEELGIGKNTVLRSHKYSKGIDALKEESPEAAEKVLQGGSGVTKSVIMDLPKAEPQKIREVAESIVKGEPIAKPEKPKPRGWTKEDRENRAQIEAIVKDMYDPSTVPEFTVELLVDDIKLNAENYVDLLRNTLKDRSTLLTPENKPIIADAIEKYVIQPLLKVKEIAEK